MAEMDEPLKRRLGRWGVNRDKLEPTSCAKGVTRGKLPHAGKELGQPTVEEGHADDDVGNSDVASMHVVEGKDKRGRCESEQASTMMRAVMSSMTTCK